MAEYVNKAAAVSIVSAMGRNTDCDCVKKRLEKAAKRISLLSSVDAAPVVHGRWDGEGDGLADGEIVLDVWYCSECGHCIDDGTDDPCVLPNYCPNCGAKMDGGGPDGR